MAVTPAIPSADPAFDAFLYNWKTLMTADPTDFGMVAGDATAISALYTTWHAAYILVTNPATRTEAAVANKNYQKSLTLILLRQQYGIIKANPAVSAENKTALGVRVTDPVPTPVPPPSTAPVLVARNNGPLSMLLDWTDQDTPTTRRKPNGVTGMVLVRKVGLTPETNPDNCIFEGMFTRSPDNVATFSSGDAGKYATFFGRWVNGKGEEGPWSAGFSQIIAN